MFTDKGVANEAGHEETELVRNSISDLSLVSPQSISEEKPGEVASKDRVDKQKKLVYLVLFCILVCFLIKFWPYTPYLLLPHPTALPTDHELVVFDAVMETSQWETSTNAIFALDIETGRLMEWVSVKGGEWWSGPVDYYSRFVVLSHWVGNTNLLIDKTGERHTLAINPDSGSVSPDGKLAVTIVEKPNCELQVIDPYNQHIQGRLELDTCESEESSIRWSPDGAYLALVSPNGLYSIAFPDTLTVYEVERNGVDLRQIYTKMFPSTLQTPIWSPSGDQLAVVQVAEYAQLWIVDTRKGNAQAILPARQEEWSWYRDMAWSPDGTQIAFTSDNKGSPPSLWVADIETQAVRQLFVPAEEDEYWYGINAISWAPGNSLVIAASIEEDTVIQCRDKYGSDGFIKRCSFNIFKIDPVTGIRTQLTHRRFLYLRSDELARWK